MEEKKEISPEMQKAIDNIGGIYIQFDTKWDYVKHGVNQRTCPALHFMFQVEYHPGNLFFIESKEPLTIDGVKAIINDIDAMEKRDITMIYDKVWEYPNDNGTIENNPLMKFIKSVEGKSGMLCFIHIPLTFKKK